VEGGTLLESGEDDTLFAWPEPHKPLKLTLG
jgi:hypothetical protein